MSTVLDTDQGSDPDKQFVLVPTSEFYPYIKGVPPKPVSEYKINKLFTIPNIRNVSLFMIAIYASFEYVYYHYSLTYEQNEWGTKPYHMLYKVVGVHALVDMFLCSTHEMIIHHLFIVGILFYSWYHGMSTDHNFMMAYPLLNTEISSVFYVLKLWLPEKTLVYHVNLLAFFLFFIKFRIYDLYDQIIYKNTVFDILIKTHTNHLSFLMIGSCYGLYLLNLYWVLVIMKIVYKSVVNSSLNSEIVCHSFCKNMYWINILLAKRIYSSMNEKYAYDKGGLIVLSIMTYIYHTDIYNKLYHKKIDEYSPTTDRVGFFMYTFAIQMRGILAVATNYYSNEYLYPNLVFSGIIHSCAIYHTILNILNGDTDVIKRQYAISSVPFVCDTFLIFMNSSKEIAIPFFLVNIVLLLLVIVKPFYKLNPVAIFTGLFAQTYYICLSSK